MQALAIGFTHRFDYLSKVFICGWITQDPLDDAFCYVDGRQFLIMEIEETFRPYLTLLKHPLEITNDSKKRCFGISNDIIEAMKAVCSTGWTHFFQNRDDEEFMVLSTSEYTLFEVAIDQISQMRISQPLYATAFIETVEKDVLSSNKISLDHFSSIVYLVNRLWNFNNSEEVPSTSYMLAALKILNNSQWKEDLVEGYLKMSYKHLTLGAKQGRKDFVSTHLPFELYKSLVMDFVDKYMNRFNQGTSDEQ